MFLQPLIEELKQLWTGVEVYDSFRKQNFIMRTAYLFSIHDGPASGVFLGWSTHGLLWYPICGFDSGCFRLSHCGKVCFFDFHRCFLPDNHEFREQINAFRKGTVVTQGLPKRLTTAEIAEWHNRLVPKGDGFAGFGKEHN
jgi:hypothetical protein